MPDLLSGFSKYLINEGKNEKTIRAYMPIIQSLERWYTQTSGEEFAPENITTLDIKDWIAYLKTNKKLSQATVNKYINAVKVYYKYLANNHDIQVNPAIRLKSKKTSVMERTPRWLTRREQAKLLHIIMKQNNIQKRLRDFAIAQLMLQAGLRISEVADQKLGDIDTKRGTITIRNGKGGKMAVLPTNKDLLKAVDEYLQVRPETESKYLFISQKKVPLTTRAIEHQFRKYLDAAGLRDATVHSLRHSFCKNMLDAGTNLVVVSQLARHESLDTTRIYLTPSQQELRQAVDNISIEE